MRVFPEPVDLSQPILIRRVWSDAGLPSPQILPSDMRRDVRRISNSDLPESDGPAGFESGHDEQGSHTVTDIRGSVTAGNRIHTTLRLRQRDVSLR